MFLLGSNRRRKYFLSGVEKGKKIDFLWCVLSWACTRTVNLCTAISQAQHCWHFGIDNVLWWEAGLCIVGFLAAPLASTYWMSLAHPMTWKCFRTWKCFWTLPNVPRVLPPVDNYWDRGLRATPDAAQTLTIDIETVSVQGVGAQQGDAVGQLTQLLVQFFYVQSRAYGVRMVGADGVHSSWCPIFLSPRWQGQRNRTFRDMVELYLVQLFPSNWPAPPSFMVFLFTGPWLVSQTCSLMGAIHLGTFPLHKVNDLQGFILSQLLLFCSSSGGHLLSLFQLPVLLSYGLTYF